MQFLSSFLQAQTGLNTSLGDMELCMDGGGVRGLVAITMLQFIEEKCEHKLKNSNVFNFYGGTSTGGILALAFALDEEDLKRRLECRMKQDLGKVE